AGLGVGRRLYFCGPEIGRRDRIRKSDFHTVANIRAQHERPRPLVWFELNLISSNSGVALERKDQGVGNGRPEAVQHYRLRQSHDLSINDASTRRWDLRRN